MEVLITLTIVIVAVIIAVKFNLTRGATNATLNH